MSLTGVTQFVNRDFVPDDALPMQRQIHAAKNYIKWLCSILRSVQVSSPTCVGCRASSARILARSQRRERIKTSVQSCFPHCRW